MTNEKFTVPTTKESAALKIIIILLFEFGDILFKPEGPNGPSLIINHEPGTEILLTKEQAAILQSVGFPCFADAEKTPSSARMGDNSIVAIKDKMRWFVSYKDGPSFEVSADKASEFIDFFKKKYRDDITEAIVEGERKMVSHSFYDRSFGWECSLKLSVIGIILEGKRNEKRE